VGDTFWMEDSMRVGWEESGLDCGHITHRLDNPGSNDILPLANSPIQEFIFQQAFRRLTDTGSQYLDPVWRQHIAKIKYGLGRTRVLISLN
jgi:hypothetical protein